MPFIQVNILEGRTEEQKLGLIRELTETACRVLGSKPEQVRAVAQFCKPHRTQRRRAGMACGREYRR